MILNGTRYKCIIFGMKKKIGVEKSLKYNTVISILNTIEREND
jgi:hypothetical protein